MEATKKMSVFILEDDVTVRDRISKELKEQQSHYQVRFFPNSESIFDLLNFYPDLIIADFEKKKNISWKDWL